ncbi:urease accessory protein UreE [Histidinibacterium lentulum]|uniref:Urease accessory protein UreE n=1 Tax=Histidinibacterium lentulum TaxID=2480588 RepID=A0A3N2QV31_9RHOB|nr:urease accessory protein UreE [Histidinibacterium lentulum]ROT99030.1 urease accessory protein UreE [Histidinibacterium lentulum]
MTDLPPARRVLKAAEAAGAPCHDCVTLDYDARLLRRRRLVTVHDEGFLVDLPHATSVNQGDRFLLADGRQIEVIAAEEALLQVTAPAAALPRLAWHIGNRHTPAVFDPGAVTPSGAELPARILIRRDPVLRRMLEGLGAEVTEVSEPFAPEGGAYGTGRTMGHSHGHGHDHGAAHRDHGEHGHGQSPEGRDTGHPGHDHDPDRGPRGHRHAHDSP